MVADANPIGPYCLDYIVNIDVRLSLLLLKQRRPNEQVELMSTGGGLWK
jgi:hypothetical protein